MPQPVGKRPLQFQSLELRAMLAGNVLVSVVGGDLRIEGDDQSNVLQLQQLSASETRAVSDGLSFRITPDADTSINRSDPGTAIVVSGVTRDIAVDMGDGSDELSLLGAKSGRQVQNLVIEAGDGPDAVNITEFKLTGDVNISAADSLDVSVEQSTGAAIDVKVANHEREPKAGAGSRTSSVTIGDSHLRRNVNVSSDGPLVVKTHKVSIGFPDVCKTPAPAPPVPIPAPPPPPCGVLGISSGAPLTADINQTRASDVFVKIADIKGEAEGGAEARTSAVTIRNSDLRRDVNVSSDAPLSLDIQQTKAKGDLLIQAVGTSVSSDLRGTEFTNTIRVVDSIFGSLKVIGSESRDEVSLARLHVVGRSHIDMGGGNDSLTVADSLLKGFAVLDGGDDDDSLILLGTKFRRGSRIVNWE